MFRDYLRSAAVSAHAAGTITDDQLDTLELATVFPRLTAGMENIVVRRHARDSGCTEAEARKQLVKLTPQEWIDLIIKYLPILLQILAMFV